MHSKQNTEYKLRISFQTKCLIQSNYFSSNIGYALKLNLTVVNIRLLN